MKPIIMSNERVIRRKNARIINDFDVQMGSVYKVTYRIVPLVLMQIIEYTRAFTMGRISFGKLNLILIISGAFSVFSKNEAIAAGGYSPQIIGEDMELVVKLHRYLAENKIKKLNCSGSGLLDGSSGKPGRIEKTAQKMASGVD